MNQRQCRQQKKEDAQAALYAQAQVGWAFQLQNIIVYGLSLLWEGISIWTIQ